MSPAEIIAFFPPTPLCLTHLGAASYAVPVRAWLLGKCYEAFRARYWSENLNTWTIRWECRDFARAFACFAQECWALTEAFTSDDGMAVGEIWFIPDARKPAEGHAICPIFTENGLEFLEPQTGQLWPITPAQFYSRYFLRF